MKHIHTFESFVNEGAPTKTREFELEIINKNGKNTIQKVDVNPASTELFDIIADLKKSPNIKDVKILEK